MARALFTPVRGAGAADPRIPRFGCFLGRDGRPVDHGYLVEFPEGASFTGEPTAELWPHGSPTILAEIVAAAMGRGARAAGPGEFTYRALRRGRLDLARAEAVRDLVAARTLYQARAAFAQAEGALSRRLSPLRDSIESLIVRAEAALEFSEEAEVHLPLGVLPSGIRAARAECAELLDGYRTGRLVREGATIVLTGLPNVGKSSLFNRLLARDRAIVTPIPGTTRDTLEEGLDLGGVPVRLVDTAGLREGGDPVEDEGVRRARAARQEADLALLVLDASRPLHPDERQALAVLDGPTSSRCVAVVNKSDLVDREGCRLPHPSARPVSARTGEGVDALRELLRERLLGSSPLEEPIVTDARHARALEAAAEALARAATALDGGFTEEIALEELREARGAIDEITGAFTTEDLYDRVFSTFCIGK